MKKVLQYAARLTPELPEEGGYTVTFRDVPEAITEGSTLEEALHYAQEVLVLALEHYLGEKRSAPVPTAPKKGEHLVTLPISLALQLTLMNEMVAQGVRPVDLAKRLGTSKQEVNRLTTLRHVTKVDRIADALTVLGKRIEIHVA
jgi:antitoxin HicB